MFYMRELTCEKALWETIPFIRKQIACYLVRDFGLKQVETAKLLDLTPAAISQYKCKKRAIKEIENPVILEEIRSSAKKLVNNGDHVLNSEICRLCRLINNEKSRPR